MMGLVLLVVFVGTILLVVAGYMLLNRRRLLAGEALRARLAPTAPVAASAATILKDARTSEIAALDRLLAGKGLTAALAARIERAGSSMSVGVFVLLTLVCGAVGLLVGQRITLLAGLLVAALAGAIPLLLLARKERARLSSFQAQLPEAVDMLVNAMKSGYSLQAAIRFAGEEMPQPLGPEFSRVYDEQRLGMDLRNALLGLQERMRTLDCKMFVTALLLQRETGGNLAEVLTNISTLMRERVGLRGQIDTLTAEPRLSAIVLTLLPVALFILVGTLNPGYLSPLWTTPIGRVLLLIACVSVILGYAILRKIGNIDI